MKLVGIDSSRARLEHARIVDGLGTPARDDSLAVKDGRIAAISMDVLLVDDDAVLDSRECWQRPLAPVSPIP
jgi:N-acyl-D-aspartate/D-glutamate deacylase